MDIIFHPVILQEIRLLQIIIAQLWIEIEVINKLDGETVKSQIVTIENCCKKQVRRYSLCV